MYKQAIKCLKVTISYAVFIPIWWLRFYKNCTKSGCKILEPELRLTRLIVTFTERLQKHKDDEIYLTVM
jgi:hypothetical protein